MTHTLSGLAFTTGFYDADNIAFIQEAISRELGKTFRQRIAVDTNSIVRVMQRVYEEKLETVPQMNERVVMELCHEFRASQAEVRRNMNWEEGYVASQLLYNPIAKMSQVDHRAIKLHHGVGGTKGFVFF